MQSDVAMANGSEQQCESDLVIIRSTDTSPLWSNGVHFQGNHGNRQELKKQNV